MMRACKSSPIPETAKFWPKCPDSANNSDAFREVPSTSSGPISGLGKTVSEFVEPWAVAAKCLVTICLAISISCIAFAQQTWQQVPIPPLAKFKPQEPTRIQLPNGMVIFLQED